MDDAWSHVSQDNCVGRLSNAPAPIMQNEDFPALGGGQAGAGGTRSGFPMLVGTGQQSGGDASAAGGAGGGQQVADIEQLLRYQQQQQQARAAAASAGATLLRGVGAGGTVQDKAAAVAASAPDRHGLLGLLPLLKMADADLTMLTLGTDLTGLGLNLNAPGSLHRSFASPLSDNPIRTNEPEFEIPACYRHAPQRLLPGHLSKFKEETLFYVFYSMPQEEAQLVAADELYTRGWFWHRRVKLWMISQPNVGAPQKTQRGERGSYLMFDPSVWEVVPKGDVEILYEELEQHPRLPRAKQLSPTGGVPAGGGAAAGGNMLGGGGGGGGQQGSSVTGGGQQQRH